MVDRRPPGPYADPWAAYLPKQTRCRSGDHDGAGEARRPAPIVVRGGTLFVHDREFAQHFLDQIAQAFVSSVPSTARPAVTVQSPPGEGWRSQLVAKKQLKAAQSSSTTASASSLCVETEVATRLAAIEVSIRKLVELQIEIGTAPRTSSDILSRDDQVLSNAAKHNFGNQLPFCNVPVGEWRHAQRGLGTGCTVAMCKFFRNGQCSFGTNCRFRHDTLEIDDKSRDRPVGGTCCADLPARLGLPPVLPPPVSSSGGSLEEHDDMTSGGLVATSQSTEGRCGPEVRDGLEAKRTSQDHDIIDDGFGYVSTKREGGDAPAACNGDELPSEGSDENEEGDELSCEDDDKNEEGVELPSEGDDEIEEEKGTPVKFNVGLIRIGLRVATGASEMIVIRDDRPKHGWRLAFVNDRAHGWHETSDELVANVLSGSYRLIPML